MNDRNPSSTKQDRELALARDRRKILGMSPEQALEAITEHPYPVSLVQSMAEEDFFFLVHHIGPDEAMPVLSLASNRQWEYLLDMEGWHRDQTDNHLMTQWLARLLKSDTDRFTHWVARDKKDEITYYLFRNIELHIREYEQDPGEIKDDFFSEDQTYYVRLRPYPKAYEKKQQERDLFVKDLLNRLSVYDYAMYRDLLIEADNTIPAEAEEELYRQRHIRLAEKGLLPFDEAMGIYQPLKVSDLLSRGAKAEAMETRVVDTFPLLIENEPPDADANLFARTLNQVHDKASLQKLQTEFAALCNQVITADQTRLRNKEVLNRIVRKVGDYISIGLEKAASEIVDETPYFHANMIRDYLLADIFRVGYGCALALKWNAEKWQRASWFSHAGLPLSFWGENLMGVLGGLLIKKPLYYDNYSTGVLYREFACLEDIEKTEGLLKRIIAFDDLISLMGIEIGSPSGERLLTYQNLLLTLWANHYLEMDADKNIARPLTMEQFFQFYNALWLPGPEPHKISDEMRTDFLNWLADSSGLNAYDISQRMAPSLEQLFKEIEDELGTVKKKDLDARYITLFLLDASV